MKSSTSGPHQLDLERTLRSARPEEHTKAQLAYGEAVRPYPPRGRPAPPPPPPIRRQLPSVPEAASEIEGASKHLRESVDKICEALVLVFGKMEDVGSMVEGQARALRRITRWLAVVVVFQLIVCVATAFLAYQLSESVADAAVIRGSQKRVVMDLEVLTKRLSGLERSTKETQETVQAVKTKSDKAPTVAIISDRRRGTRGGAVVKVSPSDAKRRPVYIPLRVEEAHSLP